MFLPMIGCILISSNLSSIVGLARFGPRVLIATGMLLGAGGMAYLTQVTVTSGYASAVLPALLILGLGFGMIFAPAINTATFGVARQESKTSLFSRRCSARPRCGARTSRHRPQTR